jgi:hypothetical protein
VYVPYTAAERVAQLGELADLGFSLKPPKWARNLIKKAVSATKVNVDLPGLPAPIQVDMGDPESIKRLRQTVGAARASVSIGPREPSISQQLERAAEAVPGWVWPAGIGVLALLLLRPKS